MGADRRAAGLYKIFDEILVNAADNKRRDPNMKELRVDMDVAAGRFTVRNDGKGIPVEIHEEHGVYIPEMIFGAALARAAGGANPCALPRHSQATC